MPNLSNAVQFKYGSQAEYDSRVASGEVVNDAVYFAKDSRRMFVGTEEYTRPVLSGTDVPAMECVPKSLYIREVAETESKELYYNATGATDGWSLVTQKSETPDWNAAEGESGHVLNRTHYSEKTYETFYENESEGLSSVSVSESGLTTAYLANPRFSPLVSGVTYRVTVNGVVRGECKCFVGASGFTYVRSDGPSGEGYFDTTNRDGFCLYTAYEGQPIGNINGLRGSDISCRLLIEKVTAENVHVLDPKFIPDSVKVPPSASDDEGKVLTVVDGVPQWSQNLEIASDQEVLSWLAESGIVSPVTSKSGEIYTSNSGEIYIL